MPVEMKYRLIIFDFDGTLADSFPWFASIMEELSEQFGFRKLSPHEYEALRGLEPRKILQRLGVPLWKVPVIAQNVRQRMGAEAGRIPLFDGVDELLRALSDRGAELGITTSNSQDNVRRILGPQNAERFRYYECGSSMFGKPARVRRILARSGIRTDQTILIGDEIRDLEAARKCDIAFGAVSWGYNTKDALHARGPRELFATFDEIVHKLST